MVLALDRGHHHPIIMRKSMKKMEEAYFSWSKRPFRAQSHDTVQKGVHYFFSSIAVPSIVIAASCMKSMHSCSRNNSSGNAPSVSFGFQSSFLSPPPLLAFHTRIEVLIDISPFLYYSPMNLTGQWTRGPCPCWQWA